MAERKLSAHRRHARPQQPRQSTPSGSDRASSKAETKSDSSTLPAHRAGTSGPSRRPTPYTSGVRPHPSLRHTTTTGPAASLQSPAAENHQSRTPAAHQSRCRNLKRRPSSNRSASVTTTTIITMLRGFRLGLPERSKYRSDDAEAELWRLVKRMDGAVTCSVRPISEQREFGGCFACKYQ